MTPSAPRPRRAASRGVLAACLALSGAMAAHAETIEVQPGDTFSGIAARYEGSPRYWQRLYDAARTGLANPNFIVPGMKFELVTEGDRRYLRLLAGGPSHAPAVAAAAPAAAAPAPKATAVAPAPAPAPAPAAAPAVAPAPAGPLSVGVVPNIASATLLSQYANMKAYLERRNEGQPADIIVPANFKVFFDAMLRGDYDIAVAPPHFARVAQLDGGLIPIGLYDPRIAAQLIVPIENGVASAAELRGKSVAFANPTSLVAMYGVQFLRSNKLESGTDYQVVPARTDVGVGRLLLSGEAAAAIMSNGEFRALAPEESARLRILEVFARMPNFIVLAHPRLGTARIAALKAQWQGLGADGTDGAAFLKATGLNGVVDPDDAVLKELDPFVAQTRKVMGVGK